MEKVKEKIDLSAEFIRTHVRAAQGLPIHEDKYAYLMDIEDIRERTSLPEFDSKGHSAMRLLAKTYDELVIYDAIAEMEDHYARSIDGEGLKLAAIMATSKKETTPTGELKLTLPQVETKSPEETKKKHWWNR
jgi:hypothetical protein